MKEKSINNENMYSKYARFYDQLESASDRTVNFIKKTIQLHNPESKTVFEIACGTGNVLSELQEFEISGLDLSNEMVRIAKSKLPEINIFQADMTDFELDKKIDVIFCVYDSINHLLDFQDWIKTFECVANNLNEKGLFIFDMNTQKKLSDSIHNPIYATEFDGNFLLMKITKPQSNKYAWDIKIFEPENGKYKLHNEVIYETSFDVEVVKIELQKNFEIISITNPDESEYSEESKRIVWVCRKK